MSETINYQELARRYGLEPVPESVLRLTQIVSKQDADIQEVAGLISKDPVLTKRLLRAANPMSKTEADYTVETVDEALMRNGLGCALLLAMGTPLALALVKTFQTMLGLKLESLDPRAVLPLEGQHLLGTISFSGRAAGLVYLRLSMDSATEVAARILGLEPKQISDLGEINDTIGELLNIITGNFKSNLCDAGLDCRLEPPRVRQTSDFSTPRIPGGSLERMTFRTGQIRLFVDLQVNPWNDE
jgi:CheY-specific phosphatase CheX